MYVGSGMDNFAAKFVGHPVPDDMEGIHLLRQQEYRMHEKVVTLPKFMIGTRIREWYHPKRRETAMWIVYSFVPLLRLKLRLCPIW